MKKHYSILIELPAGTYHAIKAEAERRGVKWATVIAEAVALKGPQAADMPGGSDLWDVPEPPTAEEVKRAVGRFLACGEDEAARQLDSADPDDTDFIHLALAAACMTEDTSERWDEQDGEEDGALEDEELLQ